MTKLAYILAASHSGSTLLSMLLGAHPQIATIGEMKLSAKAMGDLDRYRCSCGSLIQECAFWRQVREGMADRGFAFDLACAGTDYREIDSRYARRLLAASHKGRLFEYVRDAALGLSPVWRSQLPEVHRRNSALAATVARITGTKVIVDSSKSPLRLKYLLRNSELDVKVIRLIRDGRAVALTYMDPANFADAEDPNKRAGGMGGDRAKERLTMTQAAYEWRRCMEEAKHVLRSLNKSQWIEVHYENLCEDTDNTLWRLFEFLDLVPQKRIKDYRSVEQHVIGNGMRLDTTSEIRLDERWRAVLTDDELKVFNRIAGKLNLQYGYM